MNPATSILFLGLVLSTAQGFQVKSFTADPNKPAEGSQVTLTATPDGDWKKCTVTLDEKKICDITKGAKDPSDDTHRCFHKVATKGTEEKKIGNCGVTVFAAQAGHWTVEMTADADTEAAEVAEEKLELTVGPANGAGIHQLGMAIWIQLASTFALYKVAF